MHVRFMIVCFFIPCISYTMNKMNDSLFSLSLSRSSSSADEELCDLPSEESSSESTSSEMLRTQLKEKSTGSVSSIILQTLPMSVTIGDLKVVEECECSAEDCDKCMQYNLFKKQKNIYLQLLKENQKQSEVPSCYYVQDHNGYVCFKCTTYNTWRRSNKVNK